MLIHSHGSQYILLLTPLYIQQLLLDLHRINLGQGLYDEDQGVIVGYKEELKEEYIENHDCGLAYD
tara:strand:- start:278 stop:475 length:198 start_codon:yes stop_codon:yes gene_type:complete